MNMNNPESAFAKVEYRLVNNTVKDLLVKKNGGLNYIIPGLTKPTNYSTLVLVVKIDLPKEDAIFINSSVITNPLDKRVVELIEARLKLAKDNTPFRSNLSPISFSVNVELTSEFACGDENEIVSEMFGFTLALDLSSFNKFVGCNVESGLDLVEEAIIESVNKSDAGYPLITGVVLVDRHSALPPLWIHQLGNGELVPTLRTGSKPDGLYYTIGKRHGNIVKAHVTLENLTDIKMKELGIFTDQRTAAVGGNSKLLQQMQSKVEDTLKEGKRLRTSLEDSIKGTEGLNIKMEELKSQLNLMKLKSEYLKVKADATKTKSDGNFFLDLIKTFGSLAGVFFTGYKLFSS